MAQSRRGPVKPPTIDLTAKKAAEEKAADGKTAKAESDTGKAEPGKSQTSKAQAPKTEAAKTAAAEDRSRQSAGTKAPDGSAASPDMKKDAAGGPSKKDKNSGHGGALLAGLTGIVGGGVVGLGLAYGLALQGYWPQPPAAPGVTAADLSALQTRLEGEISAAGQTAQSAISDLEARTKDLADTTSGLSSDLQAVKASPVPSVDLDPLSNDIAGLKTQLTALTGRVDALSLGAEAKPDSQVPAALTELRSGLDTLQTRLADLQSQMQTGDSKLSALDGKVATLGESIAGLKTELSALQAKTDKAAEEAAKVPAISSAQVPLALSGFTDALAAGLPYANELSVLTTALDGLTVPQVVADHAKSGLPAPAGLQKTLEANVPEMLAAQPVAPDASWQDKALDRLKALLALRPTGPVAGDTPDAVLSRLEAAVRSGDFSKAAALFGQLPAAMQSASGLSQRDLSALGAAQGFAETARNAALEPQGETAQ